MAFWDNTFTTETLPACATLRDEFADTQSEPAPSSRASRAPVAAGPIRRRSLVLVVRDDAVISDPLREMCAFLDIALEWIDGDADLLPFLQRCHPMAVIAAMDAADQDGANVLMTVARHDRSLPVLLVTDGDPVLAGAVEAVAELWDLTAVTQVADWSAPGDLAEFLCRAGLLGRCLALLPT